MGPEEAKKAAEPKLILRLELPAEAAHKLIQQMDELNISLAQAGLPRIESMQLVDPPDRDTSES